MAKSKFDKAFAKARLNKASTFDYEGDEKHKKGSYSTALKGEDKFAPRAAPKPSASTAQRARHESNVAKERKYLADNREPGIGERIKNTFTTAADEVKQLPGRAVEKGLRAIGAPSHVSLFAGTLLGNRQKITESDLDDDARAQLRRAARRATKHGGDIQYEDYDTPLKRGSLDKEQAAAQTVGRTGKGNTTREGKGYRVRDKYDFSNEGRDSNADRYAKMNSFERAATVVGETLRDAKRKGVTAALKGVPSRLGNAYIGRDSREVDIKVAKGGLIAPRHPNMPSRFMDSDASRAQLEKEIKERYRKSPDPKNDRRLMDDAKLHNELFNPNNMAKGGSVKKFAKGGMVRGDGCATKGKTKGRFI